MRQAPSPRKCVPKHTAVLCATFGSVSTKLQVHIDREVESGTFLSWPSCRSMHPVLKTSFCGQVGHHACSFVVFVPKGKHASNLALLVICEFVLTQIACDYRKCVAGAV